MPVKFLPLGTTEHVNKTNAPISPKSESYLHLCVNISKITLYKLLSIKTCLLL